MDKNTFTGLFLIMIIMGASIFFMKPSQDELKKGAAAAHADSVKKGLIHEPAITKIADTAKKTVVPKTVDTALLKSPFGAATVGTDKLVTLENKDVIIKLTTKTPITGTIQIFVFSDRYK